MYDSFDQDINNGQGQHSNKKTALFLLTFICVMFFVILMLRSYQIYNKQKNIDDLEVIKSTTTEIKQKNEKTIDDVVVENIDQSYFEELENKKENNDDELDNIITNLENNNTEVNLDKKIQEPNVKKEEEPLDLDLVINDIQKQYNTETRQSIIKVQLASLQNKDYVNEFVNNLKKQDIFNNLKENIEETNINNQTFYRVQFGNFDSKENANDFCKKYKELNKNATCVIIEK